MYKCLVMREGRTDTFEVINLRFRPMVGDFLPLAYIKEEITHIVIVTPLVSKDLMQKDKDTDFIVYTK